MKEGQFVICQKGDTFEIGKIKSMKNKNKAWVWYHRCDTTALTDIALLKPILNDYCIKDLLEKEI